MSFADSERIQHPAVRRRYDELRAMEDLRAHAPDGVAVVEAWLGPDQCPPGDVHRLIARIQATIDVVRREPVSP